MWHNGDQPGRSQEPHLLQCYQKDPHYVYGHTCTSPSSLLLIQKTLLGSSKVYWWKKDTLQYECKQGRRQQLQTGRIVGDVPQIMTQFGYHAHFKIMQDVPHPNPIVFSSKLDELENWSWRAMGGNLPQSPLGATTECRSRMKPSEEPHHAAREMKILVWSNQRWSTTGAGAEAGIVVVIAQKPD